MSSDHVSSAVFSENEEEEDGEPPEMKFDPLPVKTEIVEEEECDQFLDTSINSAAASEKTSGDDKGNGAKNPKRPTRNNSRRVVVEDGAEEGDDDDDYDPDKDDDHDEWGKSKKKGRRGGSSAGKSTGSRTSKIVKATVKRGKRPQSLKSQMQNKSEKDRQLDDAIKKELESNSGEEEDNREEDDKVKKKKRTPRNKSVSFVGSGAGRRRKRISEMTDEEREITRRKWKEQRERRKNRLTPEELEARKERERLRKRTLRADLTQKETRRVEEQYRKDSERRRARRAALTPDQRREEAQRVQMYRIAKKARMTEEEIRARKNASYMQYVARKASLPPEEIERRREKRREAARKRWEQVKQTPGEQDRITEMNKKYRHNMEPEMRQRFLDKMKDNYRKWIQTAKQDPQKFEQMKQQWKENKRKRKQMIKELGADYVPTRKPYTKSVQDQITRRRLDGGIVSTLTEDEKKEKQRLYLKRSKIRKRLKIQQMLESGMTMEEIRKKTETPEQRERNLIKNRLKKQRWLLRTKLRALDWNESEIEEKVKEMEANFKPVMSFKPYKPLPTRWRPVQASELDLLRMGREGKADVAALKSNSTKPITLFKQITKVTPSTSSNAPPPILQKDPEKKERPSINKQEPQLPAPPPLTFTPSGSGVVYPMQQYPTSYQTSVIQYNFQSTANNPSNPQQQQNHPQNPNQSYSLQNILDSIRYQIPTNTDTHQIPSYSPRNTDASSGHPADYASSYVDDDDGNKYSPPSSPPLGDQQDFSSSSSFYTQPPNQSTPHTTPTTSFLEIPLKTPRSKKPRKQSEYKPRPGAKRRTKRSEVIRDVVCDECGQAFNSVYLKEHQRYYHNPHYDVNTRTCRICDKMFKLPAKWYSHYLHDHVKASSGEPPEDRKPQMCPECGKTFKSKENLKKHNFFTHGEGSIPQNYKKCPVCPEERLFKEVSALQSHIKRSHPGYKHIAGDHPCHRCSGGFVNERELRDHVKTQHPQSYFPCGYCNVVRFTQMALNFHYDRCPKVSRELRQEKVTSWDKEEKGVYSMQRVQIQCQFCEKRVNMSSLTRHYKEVHNVQEDQKFVCLHCQKEFVQRRFLAVHLEEVHCDSVDVMCTFLRLVRSENLEGLRMQQHKEVRRSRREGGSDGEKGSNKGKGRKKKSVDDEKDMVGGGMRRQRRNILVICEEDKESLSLQVQPHQKD